MIVGKIKHLSTLTKDDNPILHNGSVKSNFIDDEIFKDAIAETNKIKSTIEEKDVQTPFFKQLNKDVFNCLYKVQPEIYSKENLYKSLHMENDIFSQLISNEKFNNLRKNTCGDIFNSTVSLGIFQDKAVKLIDEWVKKNKENKKTMEQINDALDSQNQLQDLLDKLNNGEGGEGIENQINNLSNKIDNLNNKINSNANTSNLNNNLNKLINSMEKEVQENQDALDSFGMSNKGGNDDSSNPNKIVPFEQKRKVIELLKKSKKFKEVTNQLGRMKEMVGKISKKTSKYGQIICDIGLGNSINKVLSSEKIKLLDSDLENEFYKKYINKDLLEYKTQGIEDSKGPIVVCLDVSGSMDGDLEIWSKSVTIASLQLAASQKRSFRCIAFNTKVVKVWDIDNNSFADNIDKVLEISELDTNGGTNFEKPLVKALESIQESKYNKADILFITDGCPNGYLSSTFNSKLNSAKANKGFIVQSIMIGGASTSYLEEFSDSIITLKDLNKDNELVNIFNNMKNK